MIDQLLEQIQRTEERYQAHQARREMRRENLAALGEGGDWREIDDQERILNRLDSLDMAEEAMPSFGIVGPGPAVTPAEKDAPPPETFLERILGANELVTSYYLIRGAAITQSVGRIVIRNAWGRVLGHGTGFLVSPALLMTNNHVLSAQATAQNSIVEFNYFEALDGRLTNPIRFKLQPGRFFHTDKHLDFTLVAVHERNDQGLALSSLGWNRLIAESGKAIVGERVNIIQHPGGERQRLALRQNQISDILDDFLHYSADTERGSSGSPVFNDQWELAALHHAGVPKRDENERILLVSGDPWNGSAQTIGQIAWQANEGTRISRIVSHLQEKLTSASATEQALFEQAFTAPPEVAFDEHEVTGAQPGDQQGSGLSLPGPRFDDRGRAIWTIPIEIRVGVGQGGAVTVTAGSESPPSADEAPPTDSTAPDPEQPVDDPGLQDALDNVSAAEGRPYYEADQDQEQREAYYADIDPSHRPETLFKHLHRLVRDTHTIELDYDEARHEHLYPWVDLREGANGQRELRSIYSGKGFEPEEIIREDFAIAAHREALLREMIATESALTDEKLRHFSEQLEALAPFNCEHVVPQSWFAKGQPMKGDLHHLFTCEWGCNSFRGNTPYFQFDPADEVIRDDCGQLERTQFQFEPAAGKGPVARATLYFLLRYPGMIGDDVRELQKERLPILLQWHQSEPVTDYERHRNAAIFAAQGNRNPFIDFPDWVTKVDFDAGFGIV
ncbi:MAG: endonuclease [Candidatus Promineifilaceae bacterium]|nr:endonuclease [Candidatus Promineifilaceae bacterium]